MRDRHVEIEGSKLKFRFRGKSGQKHEIEIRDRRLARIIKQMRDLPGHNLFQYIDDEGERQTIGSSDVNDYLREITGKDFSAKDYRTWGGTVLAAGRLRHFWPYKSEAEAKRMVAHAIREVSNHLGNKPGICRKYYVHPVVISAYMEGELVSVFAGFGPAGEGPPSGYQLEEMGVLTILRQRLAGGRASDEALDRPRGGQK